MIDALQKNKFRIDPERIGLVIDVRDHDSFRYALPVADLMMRIFEWPVTQAS